MKVLLVSSTIMDEKGAGGAEKLCFELFKEFKKNGHTVKIAANFRKNYYFSEDLYYLSKITNKYARKLLFDYFHLLNIFKLKRILNDFKPDIVHFHNVYGISSYLIKYVSQKYHTIVTIHDYWPICYWGTLIYKNKPCEICYNHDNLIFPQNYLHKLHNVIISNHFKQSHLVAPSRFMSNKLRRIGHFKHICTIPNGTAENQKITTYKKNIIWVGRLSEEKGLQTIIDILDNIVNKNKDWKVYILGEGKFKKQLESKYKNIIFCGFRNPEEYYLSSSILLFTSTWPENLPYSIIEAMSHGLAVIASNVGGVKELIQPNKTGILYPARNTKVFANQIIHLIENQELIKKLGRAAYNEINKKYSLHEVTYSYLNLYNDLLKHD